MSGIPVDYRDQLDLRAVIAKIDRDRAEDEKLREEAQKFMAEQRKLLAEARKFRWDPILVIAGAIIAGVFLRLPEILQALRVGP